MAKRTRVARPEVGTGENVLFYGDNLDVLRRYVADASVDLIYLDPPFNSSRDFNAFFAERDGSRAAAQIKAFEDTWTWDEASARAYEEIVTEGPDGVSRAMQAFRSLLGDNDMLAYLSMMAPRLVELHRSLKSTGSLYLHCDPTASHYLKIVMDAIFGVKNFRNEIVWKRTHAHGSSRKFGPVHDVILFYSKTHLYKWNQITQPFDQSYLDSKYRFKDERGVYRLIVLTGAGTRNGDSGKPWRGYDPTQAGRHWALPRRLIEELVGAARASLMTVHEKLDYLDENGFVYFAVKGRSGIGGVPQLKFHLPTGAPVQDIFSDIPPVNSQAQERLGYPTQKPEALLDRIISASSDEDDVVLDPFCGCGTAVSVAERLARRWQGIDITHLAIGLIRSRLRDAYGDEILKTFRVIGEPVSIYDAANLAEHDRYQFQYWALGLVGARPAPPDRKKGPDRGIDGRLYFHDDGPTGKTKQIIFSVKSGNVDVSQVRDLRGVLEREKADMGVFLTLNDSTGPMRAEAAGAGFYASPWGTKHPRLQILTVGELLEGRKVDMPPSRDNRTLKRAPIAERKVAANLTLPFDP